MTVSPDRLGPDHRGTGPTADPCAAPSCRRSATVGRLCPSDANRLGQMLVDIGQDWHRLSAAPTTAGAWGPDSTGHGGLASERAPARLDVIALRDRRSWVVDDGDDGQPIWLPVSVPGMLAHWAGIVRTARGLAPSAGQNLDRRLLADHLTWIVRQDWAGLFFRNVRLVWGRLKAATGQRTGPRPVMTCPTLVGAPPARCGGPVWLDRDAAYCGACGTTWSGFQLVRLARERGAA